MYSLPPRPTMASAPGKAAQLPNMSPINKVYRYEALGQPFLPAPRKLDLCYLNANRDPQVPQKTVAEERITTPKLPQNRAQHVQNQWQGSWSLSHNTHSLVPNWSWTPTETHKFYHPFTSLFTQPVHKISAILAEVKGQFSAVCTGPITTTTTFIYKKIEKEAA